MLVIKRNFINLFYYYFIPLHFYYPAHARFLLLVKFLIVCSQPLTHVAFYEWTLEKFSPLEMIFKQHNAHGSTGEFSNMLSLHIKHWQDQNFPSVCIFTRRGKFAKFSRGKILFCVKTFSLCNCGIEIDKNKKILQKSFVSMSEWKPKWKLNW